jgi:hypothetical protein
LAKLPHSGGTHQYLNYPRAGHVVFYLPYSAVRETTLAQGGTVASDSAAWISDWPKVINFVMGH